MTNARLFFLLMASIMMFWYIESGAATRNPLLSNLHKTIYRPPSLTHNIEAENVWTDVDNCKILAWLVQCNAGDDTTSSKNIDDYTKTLGCPPYTIDCLTKKTTTATNTIMATTAGPLSNTYAALLCPNLQTNLADKAVVQKNGDVSEAIGCRPTPVPVETEFTLAVANATVTAADATNVTKVVPAKADDVTAVPGDSVGF